MLLWLKLKTTSAVGLFCFALLTSGVTLALPNAEREVLIALYNSTDGANWTTNDGWLGPAGTECDWHGVSCSYNPTTGEQFGLYYLSLRDNNLVGTIPEELGNLTQIKNIDLWGNLLSGPIPEELRNLRELTSLTLGKNELTGTIPSSLGDLTLLTALSLGSNELTGSIPPSLGNLTLLTYLSLSSNELTGSIPSSLGNLTLLTTLVLTNNKLSGSIPSSLGNLTLLTYLSLSSNELTGSIPSSLGNLTLLTTLVLTNNKLSGSIPKEIGNLSKIVYLYFSSNSLSGVIPDSLGNLKLAETMYLASSEAYTGSLPDSLNDLPLLIYNDFSELRFQPFDQDNDGIPDAYDDDVGEADQYKRIKTSEYSIIFSEKGMVVNLVHPKLFIATQGGSNLASDQAISNVIYNHFEDQFDFIMHAPECDLLARECGSTNYNSTVKNIAKGSGKGWADDVYDATSAFGSAGELNNVIFLIDPRGTSKNGAAMHELMHSWASPSMFKSPNVGHSGYSNIGGILGGWKPNSLEALGNGTYKIETMWQADDSENGLIGPNGWGDARIPYSNFELYLAGLIGPDEVGHDLKLAEGFAWVDQANRIFSAYQIKTTTMDEFIETNGALEPSYRNSQKIFEVLNIVVSPEPLPLKKFNEYNNYAFWLQSPGDDSDDNFYNFWEATRGKATISLNPSNHLIAPATNFRHNNQAPAIDTRSIQKIIKDIDGVSGEKITLAPILTDDNGIASVNWLIDGKIIATGSAPQINLSDGITNLTVEVTDIDFEMTSATLAIEVLAPFTVDTGWSDTFNGANPDPSLGLPFNNIGNYDFSKKILSSCLRLLKDGEIFNYSGISNLEVNFAVVSDELGILKLANSRGFNPLNLVNEQGEPPACSGTFETTSNIYTDVVKSTFTLSGLRDMEIKIVNIFEMKFRLFDGENLLFRLESFTQLD